MPESGEPSRLDAIATRWTLLREAHGESAGAAQAARSALVLRYLPAIRRYVGAIVQKDQEAEDITQDVMMRLLAGDFAGADPARGRFRDLLKTAIRNMIRNRWRQQGRRRTVAADIANVAEDETEDARWVAEWRKSLLDLAWKALEQNERVQPGSVAFTVLHLRAEHPEDSSEELAARLSARLGRPVRADAARQQLRRARVKFADLLISEVANGLSDPTPEKIEDELTGVGLMDLMRELLPPDWRATI